MLNQVWMNPESSLIKQIAVAPIKGKKPKIRFSSLYFPVLCIIQPAKTDPVDIAKLLGSR